MSFLHLDPWNQVSKLRIGPSPGNKNRAGVSVRIPVKFGTGFEGRVGKNDEEMVGRGLVDGEQRQSA